MKIDSYKLQLIYIIFDSALGHTLHFLSSMDTGEDDIILPGAADGGTPAAKAEATSSSKPELPWWELK